MFIYSRYRDHDRDPRTEEGGRSGERGFLTLRTRTQTLDQSTVLFSESGLIS